MLPSPSSPSEGPREPLLPQSPVQMPVPVDNAPVGVSWLLKHQLLVILLVIGAVAGCCAVASLAALVVTGLVQVTWRPAGWMFGLM